MMGLVGGVSCKFVRVELDIQLNSTNKSNVMNASHGVDDVGHKEIDTIGP